MVFGIMLAGYLIHWLSSSVKDGIEGWFISQNIPVKVAISSVAGFLIYQSASSQFVPFIYFSF
jgi:hypothetical protein